MTTPGLGIATPSNPLIDVVTFDTGRLAINKLFPFLSLEDMTALSRTSRQCRQSLTNRPVEVMKDRIEAHKGVVYWENITTYETRILKREFTPEEAEHISRSITHFKQYYNHIVLPDRALDFIHSEHLDTGLTLLFPPDNRARLMEKAKNLSKLEISTHLPSASIPALLDSNKNNRRLKKLVLPLRISREQFLEFIKAHPQLEWVTLFRGNEAITTNEALLALAEHCPNLKKLEIYYSQQELSEGLQAIGRWCQVTELSLKECIFSRETLNSIGENYPNLVSLVIKETPLQPEIIPASLQAFSRLRKLEHATFIGSYITDEGLSLFTAPNLKSLFIRHCDRVSDAGLSSIGQNCPQLRTISLPYYSRGITDAGIKALLRGAPHLHLIDLWRKRSEKMDRQSLLADIEETERGAERARMLRSVAITSLIALAAFGIQFYLGNKE